MSNLVRMVYVSIAANPVDPSRGGVQTDIGRILMQARRNNPKRQVGGVLYFRNNYFLQCLEGEQQAVNEVFQKIARDPRHYKVRTVSLKRVNERLFSNWSMKYVAREDRVSGLLKENGFRDFTPFEFDDDMLDRMLQLFASASDLTDTAHRHASNAAGKAGKPGLLSRMFGLQRSA